PVDESPYKTPLCVTRYCHFASLYCTTEPAKKGYPQKNPQGCCKVLFFPTAHPEEAFLRGHLVAFRPPDGSRSGKGLAALCNPAKLILFPTLQQPWKKPRKNQKKPFS